MLGESKTARFMDSLLDEKAQIGNIDSMAHIDFKVQHIYTFICSYIMLKFIFYLFRIAL